MSHHPLRFMMDRTYVDGLPDRALRGLIAWSNAETYRTQIAWAKAELDRRGIDYADCLEPT
jgi:hypothetical protein